MAYLFAWQGPTANASPFCVHLCLCVCLVCVVILSVCVRACKKYASAEIASPPGFVLQWLSLLDKTFCFNIRNHRTLNAKIKKQKPCVTIQQTNNFDYNCTKFKARKIIIFLTISFMFLDQKKRFGWQKAHNILTPHLKLKDIKASAKPPMSACMLSVAIVYSFRLLLHNLIHTFIYIWHVAEQSGGEVQKLSYSC